MAVVIRVSLQENKMVVIKNCIVCEKEFRVTPNRGDYAKFCSRGCFHSYYVKGKKDSRILKNCWYCADEFYIYPYRKTAKFCSKICKGNFMSKDENIKIKLKEIGFQKGNLPWNKDKMESQPSILKYNRERLRALGFETKGKIIHHKDGNHYNNDLDNLQILDNQSQHAKIHNFGGSTR